MDSSTNDNPHHHHDVLMSSNVIHDQPSKDVLDLVESDIEIGRTTNLTPPTSELSPQQLTPQLSPPRSHQQLHQHQQQSPSLLQSPQIVSDRESTQSQLTSSNATPSSSRSSINTISSINGNWPTPLNTATSTTTSGKSKQSEEFVIFGSYVAEVMKNMDKQKARVLQMKVMQLITEYDDSN